MGNNIVAISPNVEGNISNCEIVTVKTDTNYKPFTFDVLNTHQVINKCDNTIINEYTSGSMGFGAGFLAFLGCTSLFFILVGLISKLFRMD